MKTPRVRNTFIIVPTAPETSEKGLSSIATFREQGYEIVSSNFVVGNNGSFFCAYLECVEHAESTKD